MDTPDVRDMEWYEEPADEWYEDTEDADEPPTTADYARRYQGAPGSPADEFTYTQTME